ncbi:hypothetical protein V1511DRAFT_323216 [Dipodascopsis uninucleata]
MYRFPVIGVRLVLLLVVLTTAVVSLIVGFTLFSDIENAHELATKPVSFVQSLWSDPEVEITIREAQEQKQREQNCIDPYKMPGYLYIPEADYKRSTYVPFYEEVFNNTYEPASYPVKDLDFDTTQSRPESDIMKLIPHMWMSDLVEFSNMSREADPTKKHLLRRVQKRVSFLQDKRVLLIADSVDRYVLMYLCEEVGETYIIDSPRHTTARCHIPSLNFTLYHWHLASYYTYRPEWWWMKMMEIVPFEERFEKIFRKTLPDISGIDGRPDLILFQTGLWDQVTFVKKYLFDPTGNNYIDKKYSDMNRQLSWGEIRYYADRMKQFIHHLRDVFGKDARIMFRSLSVHKQSDDRDLMMLNMDRVGRSLAYENDIEVFDWSKLITAFSSQWKDHVHLERGPMTWLYQNMLLSYIFRASGGVEIKGNITKWPYDFEREVEGDPWKTCHPLAVLPVNR